MNRRGFLQQLGAGAAALGATPGVNLAVPAGKAPAAVIKLLGVGGTGGAIVSSIDTAAYPELAQTLCLAISENTPCGRSVDRLLTLWSTEDRQLSEETDWLGPRSVLEERILNLRTDIAQQLGDCDVLIVVAGMFGQFEPCVVPAVASAVRARGITVLAVLITPVFAELDAHCLQGGGLWLTRACAHHTVVVPAADHRVFLRKPLHSHPEVMDTLNAASRSITALLGLAKDGGAQLRDLGCPLSAAGVLYYCREIEQTMPDIVMRLQGHLAESRKWLAEVDSGLIDPLARGGALETKLFLDICEIYSILGNLRWASRFFEVPQRPDDPALAHLLEEARLTEDAITLRCFPDEPWRLE